MVKKITVSMSNWVYDTYLSMYEGKNRSGEIERLIVQGGEADYKDMVSHRRRVSELNAQVKQQADIIKRLKAQLAKCRKEKKDENPYGIKPVVGVFE